MSAAGMRWFLQHSDGRPATEVTPIFTFVETIDGTAFNFGVTFCKGEGSFVDAFTLTERRSGRKIGDLWYPSDDRDPVDKLGYARAFLAMKIALHGAPHVRKRMTEEPPLSEVVAADEEGAPL